MTQLAIETYDALGQLHIQRRRHHRAIIALNEARHRSELLESMSFEPQAIADIHRYRRLAAQLRLTGDAEGASEHLIAAERTYDRARANLRPTFSLIAQRAMVEDQRMTLALDRADYAEAVLISRAKLKVLDEVRWLSSSLTPTSNGAEFCSKAYRQHEKLLKYQGLFREALIARLASLLLHLDRHGPTLTNMNHLTEVHDALWDIRAASDDCEMRENGAVEIRDELAAIYTEYDFESGSSDAVWATLRAVRWRMAQQLPPVVNFFGERDRLFDRPVPRHN